MQERSTTDPPSAASLLDTALDAIDELIEADADLQSILNQTAGILGCRIGVCGPDDERTAGGPRRPESSGGAPRATHPVPGVGEVWIEDAAALTEPEVDRVAHRLGVASKVDLLRRQSAGDLPLMSVVDAAVSTEVRASVLRRLGLEPSDEITVFVMVAPGRDAAAFVEQLREHCAIVLHAEEPTAHLIIAAGLGRPSMLGIPVGARASYSGPAPAADAPEAWRLARLGLRFTRPSRHPSGPYSLAEAALVDADELGGYALFAESVTARQLAEAPDLRRLNLLVEETDDDMLVCLEAVAATDSIRKAARQLHLHHNSVTDRVRRAERYLGYPLTAPYGRTRLFLTLVMRRLLDSADLLGS